MHRFTPRDALLFATLVGVAVGSRLLPHAPNFTAVLAVGLLAAAVFPVRWVAAAVPLTAMVISDAVIGGYDARLMAAVYGAMVLPLVLSPLVAGRSRFAGERCLRAGGVGAVGSVLFFVITNGAVWAFGSMYEYSAAGLAACYAAALPFLKYQIAGDVSYSVVLFGLASVATRALPGMAGRGGREMEPAIAAA